MTDLEEVAPAGASVKDQPLPLCALVAVVIVGGCLSLEDWWDRQGFSTFAHHTQNISITGQTFVGVMGPYLVFGIALALWGREGRQGVGGVGAALLAGLVLWGAQEAFQHWIFARFPPRESVARDIEWVIELLVPLLLAAAWGLARRRGWVWVVGLVVAPVLAAIHHELYLHASWWQDFEFAHDRGWERSLFFVGPAIVAAIACWLIDVGRPEQGSSA